jgi:hypothetical protein
VAATEGDAWQPEREEVGGRCEEEIVARPPVLDQSSTGENRGAHSARKTREVTLDNTREWGPRAASSGV